VDDVSVLMSPEVRALRGLHLYHYGMSNCSQKVRICLEEKGLAWTSHHVDLRENAHVTPEYLAVNVRGLVPALVHDGVVVVESSDILEYLDEQFPDPPLLPARDTAFRTTRLWVARQDSIHEAVKILSHQFLFGRAARRSAAELDRWEAMLVKNPELVAFHREFSSAEGFVPSVIAGAVRTVEEALGELNRQLEGRQWIAGDQFTLADVAWVVDVHRLQLMRFPMWRRPAVRAWYRRATRRPSFARAVRAHEPAELRRRFDLSTLLRWLGRSHVGASRWRDRRLLAHG